MRKEKADVIVIGCGVAGLSVAASALEHNASVIILEKAPKEEAGGNNLYNDRGAFRHAHDEPDEPYIYGSYSEKEYFEDIMKVTNGKADRELAWLIVKGSREVVPWLNAMGIKWTRVPHLHSERTHRFVEGAGPGLLNTLLKYVEQKGGHIYYEMKAESLLRNIYGRVVGVKALGKEGFVVFLGKAIVLACGGFQANDEMLARYVKLINKPLLRGTKYDTGDGLIMASKVGASMTGAFQDFHCASMDARAPSIGCGTSYRIDCIPYGILVNKYGKRFLDEGEDLYTLTYAKFGRLILEQPDGIAYAIHDAKVANLYPKPPTNPFIAETIRELALKINIPPEALEDTINEFNNHVIQGIFDPNKKDGLHTEGIIPPKSNWALKIDKPPFYAYPARGGITFTFGGLKIDLNGRVLNTEDKPIPGLYATGDLIGGLFYNNYPGGTGIARNLVLGKIIGRNAAMESEPDYSILIE